MLKVKLLILAILISALSQAQIFKPHSGNWEAKGWWKFLKAIKVEGKDITAQKVDRWDSAYAEVMLNDVDLEGIIVKRSDSSYSKAGSYTSRYDFKTEPTNKNYIKTLNKYGGGIKITPIMPAGGAYVGGSNQMIDGRASYILADVTDTTVLTTLDYQMHSSGNYTTDAGEFNGMAIYSISGTTATRVAITANTPTAWSISSSDRASINLTAPVTLLPGIYYVGFLYNYLAQTTAPYIIGYQPSHVYTQLALNNNMRLGIFYSTQTSFPASFTISSTQVLGILHNFVGR